MVSATSLDSYRMKAMNPINSLEELQKIINFKIANNSDIELIYSETKYVLDHDPLLKDDPNIMDCMSSLFKKLKKSSDNKSFTKNCTLTNSLLREVIEYVKGNYIDLCFEYFQTSLVERNRLDEVQKNELTNVTSSFLSILIHSGASFETLYNYYKNILSNVKKEKSIQFPKRLALLKRIVTNSDADFEIIFRLQFHNRDLVDSFPDKVGDIRFSSSITDLITGIPFIDKVLETKYPTLKFARVSLKARDERHAGFLAYEEVYSVIDLIRFEYITQPVVILDEFVCISSNENHKYRLLEIPKLVPNPTALVTQREFTNFTAMVNRLVENKNIRKSDKDQIFSAFKFYRIGGDTHINENMLINWWIAVEHLSQSNKNGGAIGDKVSNTVIPILSLNYLFKHLTYIKYELKDVKLTYNSNAVDFSNIDIINLYSLLKDQQFIEKVKALPLLSDEHYVLYLLQNISNILQDGKSILKAISGHRKRLEKQVSRIYRARCDIVHSTASTISLSLLCANLEFYLKQTLSFILRELADKPTIQSMEEIFLRTNMTLEEVLESLNKNDTSKLEKYLCESQESYT
jgi:hypothetical protein